jgi:hypothetical protein
MTRNDDHDSARDAALDRLLRGLPMPQPPDGLAERIVGFATAQPQRKTFAPGLWAHQIWDGLTADWPHGLAYKAAAMALVAIITFGSGIEQGFRGEPRVSDAEIARVIFGDLAGEL